VFRQYPAQLFNTSSVAFKDRLLATVLSPGRWLLIARQLYSRAPPASNSKALFTCHGSVVSMLISASGLDICSWIDQKRSMQPSPFAFLPVGNLASSLANRFFFVAQWDNTSGSMTTLKLSC
jgi:hypothetical protein